MELSYSGTALSIQHAYSLLLKEKYCTLEKYRVYSHLRRQGYRVLRTAQVPEVKRTNNSCCPMPSKKARIDSIIHSPKESSISSKINEEQNLLFQQPSSRSLERSLIPNFSGNNTSITVVFDDTSLLPETCRNRNSIYVFSKTNFFRSDSELVKRDSGSSKLTDNPLFRGRTRPLISCTDSTKLGEEKLLQYL